MQLDITFHSVTARIFIFSNLTELARAINMLHLIFNTDFILGGYLAPCLKERDLSALQEKIRKLTPFAKEPDFLLISKMPEHNITIGTALPYIQGFLNSLAV